MPAKHELNVIIVGAGLGGLAAAIALLEAGHRVLILERASEITEVGAGIRVPPNSSRFLVRWGLQHQMEEKSVKPKAIILRRYKDGKILNIESIGKEINDKYGSPYWLIHRADYQKILLDKALEMGAEVKLNSLVNNIDCNIPAAILQDGSIIEGDLVLGADGLRSRVREAVVGHPDPPCDTGDMAYRVLVPMSEIRNNPQLEELFTEDAFASMNFWIGPNCHVACYLLAEGEVCNIVLLCPDIMPNEISGEIGNLSETQSIIDNWDPKLRILFGFVNKCLKSKLQHIKVESWIHPEGKVALLGDACHSMLPYLGQGAAMAIEDAVALGYFLKHCSRPEDVPTLLKAYEKTRKPRVTRVAEGTLHNRKLFHLHDGPSQKERDEVLLEEKPAEGYPNLYADPVFQRWLWGYNLEEECEKQMTVPT